MTPPPDPSPLTPEQVDKLEALAKATTYPIVGYPNLPASQALAEFRRAAHPAAVLTLIAQSRRVAALEAELKLQREFTMNAEREFLAAKAERDKAQANYQFMVDKAAENGLEHYRQMGQETLAQVERAEAAEVELVTLRVEKEALGAALQSIANSSCCGCCQEAALFARAALSIGHDLSARHWL